MTTPTLTRRGFLGSIVAGAAATALSPWQVQAAPRIRPFTFAQICDPQLGMTKDYDADIEHFRQAIRQVNELKPDFALICGDLVQKADKKSFADFNRVKKEFKVPCHCLPGNHDVHNEPKDWSLAFYRKTIGKDYFSFKHKGYMIICVNTSLWKAPVEGETQEQDKWLKEILKTAAKRKYRIIMAGHYPFYTKKIDEPESYGNLPIARRNEMLALFEEHGVVAYLSGHSHRLITNDHKGIQLVTGQSTCRTSGTPLGFRLWHMKEPPPYKHESVDLIS